MSKRHTTEQTNVSEPATAALTERDVARIVRDALLQERKDRAAMKHRRRVIFLVTRASETMMDIPADGDLDNVPESGTGPTGFGVWLLLNRPDRHKAAQDVRRDLAEAIEDLNALLSAEDARRQKYLASHEGTE